MSRSALYNILGEEHQSESAVVLRLDCILTASNMRKIQKFKKRLFEIKAKYLRDLLKQSKRIESHRNRSRQTEDVDIQSHVCYSTCSTIIFSFRGNNKTLLGSALTGRFHHRFLHTTSRITQAAEQSKEVHSFASFAAFQVISVRFCHLYPNTLHIIITLKQHSVPT